MAFKALSINPSTGSLTILPVDIDESTYKFTLPADSGMDFGGGTSKLENVTIDLTDVTLAATSAQLAGAVSDETGSGSLVFAESPTLVTPNLGTPSAAVLTNATGLPISTGVSGLGTNVATFLGSPSSGNFAAILGDETGTGSVVFSNSPSLVTPDLGTPSAINLSNGTGLPISTGVSGLGTGVATLLATFSSANLAAALTDETGSGAAVFATSPAFTTPDIGTPSAGTLTNCTGLPTSGIAGLGANVGTWLETPSSANLAAAVTGETGNGALVFGTSPQLTTPQINDTSGDHQYIFAVNELTVDRTVTLPLLTGNDEFTFNAHAATLTNKTMGSGSTWNGNVIGTTYGGFGTSVAGLSNYDLPYGDGAGGFNFLGIGSPGQVVGVTGGGALGYISVVGGVSSVTAGTGLTGGGTGAVTLNITETADTGISVTADAIAVNPDGSTLEILAGTPGSLRIKADGVGQSHIDLTPGTGVDSTTFGIDPAYSASGYTPSGTFTNPDGNTSITDHLNGIGQAILSVTSGLVFVGTAFTSLGPVFNAAAGLLSSVTIDLVAVPGEGEQMSFSDGTTTETWTFTATPSGSFDVDISGGTIQSVMEDWVTKITASSVLGQAETVQDDDLNTRYVLLAGADQAGTYRSWTVGAWSTTPQYANDADNPDFASLPTSDPGVLNWTAEIAAGSLSDGSTVIVGWGADKGSWYSYEVSTPEWHRTFRGPQEFNFNLGLDNAGGTPNVINVDIYAAVPTLQFQSGQLDVLLDGSGNLTAAGGVGIGINYGGTYSWTGGHTFSSSVGGGGAGTIDLSSFATVSLGLTNMQGPTGNVFELTEPSGLVTAAQYAEQKVYAGDAGEALDEFALVCTEATTGDVVAARATETYANAFAGVNGAPVADTDPTFVINGCKTPVLFIGGLSGLAAIGMPVFIDTSTTSGRASIYPPTASGKAVKNVGHITSLLSYDGTSDFLMEIQLEPMLTLVIP